MIDRLTAIEDRYQEIEGLLADPEISTDYARVQTLAKEHASLKSIASLAASYREVTAAIDETMALARDEADRDMAALAREEVAELRETRAAIEDDLRVALLPRDPNDDEKNVIVEVRAGTGGDEAGLFAADLYRMYNRYAQRRGWGIDVINSNESGLGSIKEIVFKIEGEGAYSRLKRESGVHRVQRVPVTESRRPRPYVGGNRSGASGGRRDRRGDRPGRPADRHLPLQRPRRPERPEGRHCHQDHPCADRYRCRVPGRALPVQE